MSPGTGLVREIRSKNAGPFWVTIDVFCRDAAAFEIVRSRLETAVASLPAVWRSGRKAYSSFPITRAW